VPPCRKLKHTVYDASRHVTACSQHMVGTKSAITVISLNKPELSRVHRTRHDALSQMYVWVCEYLTWREHADECQQYMTAALPRGSE
jgi:hypothetical protein